MRAFALLLEMMPLFAAVKCTQVNFYYDDSCNAYAGSAEVTMNGPTVGGPFGSRSMMFITYDTSACTQFQEVCRKYCWVKSASLY